MRKRPAWLIRFRVVSAVLLISGVGATAFYSWNRPNVPTPERTAGPLAKPITPNLEQAVGIDAPPALLRDFNVLLITMDTTRADHLRVYGHTGVETPHIDGLAQQGVLFSEAITPSPSTLPAHSSIHTGLYPFHHGARANGTFRLDADVQTLAETLQAAGYRTGAAISSFVLD